MGTYSKPELINVNPLSGLQAGIDKGFAGIAAGKTARKAREAKKAAVDSKNLEKKLKEKKKQIADAEDLRQDLFSLDQLDVKSFQSKFTGFAMDLIDVDLMKHEYGSTEWSEAEARIEKYIKRSNRAIQVLETEKQDWINAHEKDSVTGAWKLRENGTTGSRLIGGDEKEQDMWYVMDALMMREGEGVEFSSGKNGGAVGITLEHPDNKVAKMYAAGAGANAGLPMMDQNGKPIFEYLKEGHPDYKEPIVLNFSEYLKKKDLGDNLINTLSSESRTKAIDASWKNLSKAYDDDEQTIKTETSAGGKIETSTLVSYAQADKNLVDNITNNVDDYIPDDDKKAQNIWQQMSASKTQKIQPSKTKFNRNNPEHRAIYAAGYAAEMKSRHGKKTQLTNDQKKIAKSADDIYFDKIKNKGVEVPWAGILEEQTSYIGQDAIFIEAADNNGTAVTVGEMIENGNVTYGLVDAIAQDLVGQIGAKGDPEYGVSVSNTLAGMLNNTPNARLKGVTYQPGQEVLEGLNDTYAGMVGSMKQANGGQVLPGTKDVDGDGSIDFTDMLLCVAQGDVIPNPNTNPGNVDDWPKNVCAWDPRSWPAGMDPATSTLPNFGGATKIKNGGLFETSGSKAEVILDLKNVDKTELISDIIFDTLPINKATKNKIKGGYSTYKQPQTKSSSSGTLPSFQTQKEADDYVKANGGKVTERTVPGGKIYIVK